MRVLLATCRDLPEPDPDDRLLLETLESRGISARYAAWDDPGERWEGADLIVLRSTWNYYRRPADFLDWAERAGRAAPLCNPLDVIFWNHDKRYLLELERLGVPIVPTVRLPRGEAGCLEEMVRTRGWEEAIVKPSISASSFRTARFGSSTWPAGEVHLSKLLALGDVLIQEYMPEVEQYGERALVWIDGIFTHAVRKSPRLMNEAEQVSEAVAFTPEEAEIGERALKAVESGELLYARVDVVPDTNGKPRIMELELIEPSLFLLQSPAALDRFARAITARLQGTKK